MSVWKRDTGVPAFEPSRSMAASTTAGMPSSRPANEASRAAGGANSRASKVNRPSPSR